MLDPISATRTELENGLVLWTCPRPSRDVCIDFLVPFGLAHDQVKAHFLEHLSLRSTELHSVEQIYDDLAGKAIDSNAQTSSERIDFYCTAPSSYFESAIRFLYELFVNNSFKQKEFEREKTVIKGEYSIRRSKFKKDLWKKAQKILYKNHPLNYDEPTDEQIENTTMEDLLQAKNNYFGTQGTCIGIAGGMNEQEIIELVKKTFGSIEKKKTHKLTFSIPEHVSYEEKIESDEPGSVWITASGPGESSPEFHAISLIIQILGGGQSYRKYNRTYKEIRIKKGLAYQVVCTYKATSGEGRFAMWASGIKKQNVDKVKTVFLDELEKLKTYLVSEDELEKAKTTLLAEHYRDHFDSIYNISYQLAKSEFYGVPWSFEDYEAKINQVTPKTIQEVANKYFDDKYVIITVVPKESKETVKEDSEPEETEEVE